jgi:predicted double-glycine peptidase
MVTRGFLAISAAALLAAATAPSAWAGQASLSSGVAGTVLNVPVTSMKERPFKTVVRQEYDNSCGSAAVATLLTYHFERPTTEHDAFIAMWESGDQDRISREGFSLLEMKIYLENLGYKADGFKVPLDKVRRVGVPVIVLVEPQGYRHFVVVKGIRNGMVLIGDPARGLMKMKEADFMKIWTNGLVFAIHNADGVGRQHFDADREWAQMPSFDRNQAVNRQSLASFSIGLPPLLTSSLF